MENNQHRPKFKKIKRPIIKNTDNSEPVSVPAKSVLENPFNNNTSTSDFNLDAYLENDNLPSLVSDADDDDFEPSYVPDDGEDTPPSLKDYFMIGGLYTGLSVLVTAALFCLLGIFIAKVFFTSPSIVQNGLQGVVINSEVPKGRVRCGAAEKTQGCVLYIMNPQRQDLNGRDFYDWASQLTGRQRFMIETGNMRYSNTRIRPGEIAQINIPSLQ